MAKMLWNLGVRKDAKAAIGIGTLIVFIALVLVAAIAASVIISTSFNLRDQAIATSEAARQEVTGPVKILNMYGQRDGNPEITYLFFHLTVFNGAQGINMNNMRINFIDADTSFVYTSFTCNVNMLPGGTNGPAQNPPQFPLTNPPVGDNFQAYEVPTEATPGSNGWDPTTNLCFLDSDNVLEVAIDVSPGNTGSTNGLMPGTQVQVLFLPGSGPAVSKTFTTPTSYDNRDIIPIL